MKPRIPAKKVRKVAFSEYESERQIAEVPFTEEQRRSWRGGGLAPLWATRYPELFDEGDLRIARSQARFGYHFVEWFGAIVLHHATGFRALVAKYEFATAHPRKREIVERLLTPDAVAVLRDRKIHGNAQPPDLLMYAPDLSGWFFCEVKGPRDRLRPAQFRKFQALEALTGRKMAFLKLYLLKPLGWKGATGVSKTARG